MTKERVREIGERIGLDQKTLQRFITYINKRGFSDFSPMYIEEWAISFMEKNEYAKSDSEGVRILKAIDGGR